MLTTERREDQRAAKRAGLCRERGAGWRPGLEATAVDQGIAETRVAGSSANRRPAVMAAGHYQIDLVVAAVRERIRWPVLGLVERAGIRVPRDPLDVPVAEGPHRGAGRRIVGGDRPVLIQSQDLPGEAARVLRVRSVFGVAGGQVELPVWSELEPPAVVIVVAGDPVEQDGLVHSAVVRIAHADELVPRHAGRRGIAVIQVDEAVAREARIERDPKETLLAVAARARRNGCPWIHAKA